MMIMKWKILKKIEGKKKKKNKKIKNIIYN